MHPALQKDIVSIPKQLSCEKRKKKGATFKKTSVEIAVKSKVGCNDVFVCHY